MNSCDFVDNVSTASRQGIVYILQEADDSETRKLVVFYKTAFERNFGGGESLPYTIHFDNSQAGGVLEANVEISLSECDFEDNAGIQVYAAKPTRVIVDECDFDNNGGNPTSFVPESPITDGGCVFIKGLISTPSDTPSISFTKSKFKDTTGGMFYERFIVVSLLDIYIYIL